MPGTPRTPPPVIVLHELRPTHRPLISHELTTIICVALAFGVVGIGAGAALFLVAFR